MKKPPRELVSEMIRVNQAGEYGAKRIYEGQLAVLRNAPCGKTIEHMAHQEERHLEAFNRLLVERRVRPTALSPLWHAAGYALGFLTARLGEKAAMACTVAVEEVIDAHYAEQEKILEDIGEEEALKSQIKKFRSEELEHRDIGLALGAEETTGYFLLKGLIKVGSQAAIWLSKRF